MRLVYLVPALLAAFAPDLAAQQLRKVPQRFAYVQPLGLIAGIGTAGFEFAPGHRTTVEIGGLGVYTDEDGVRLFGAGGGLGARRYLGSGEPAGLFLGARADAVWLRSETAVERASSMFLGLGLLGGYRWVTRGGVLIETVAGYEGLFGPRPLISASGRLQDRLGLILGVGLGWAW